MQEFNTILFWLLLSVVCFQGLRLAKSLGHAKQESAPLTKVAGCLSDMFLRWQLTSLMLALSFFPFTAFYWDLVVRSKDARFLPAAIILHVMWSIAWVIISVPLFQAWSRWRAFKTLALENALKSQTTKDVTEALAAAEPIGDWAKAISGTLTTLSFAAPLMKALLS